MPKESNSKTSDSASRSEEKPGLLASILHNPFKKRGKPDMDVLSQNSQDEDDDDEDDDADEDEEDDEQAVHIKGAYDPADYENLTVSADIKELFSFITRYTPQTIELEHKLRPFIPDFIPAVGDIDAFIKVPPPDGSEDKLGLTVLDEPSSKQSDPTVLGLQLRALSKETITKTTVVKSLSDAEKHPKEIDAWIESIGNLHRSKPPPTVHYAKNMPDIESLMQEWPPEFEELLKKVGLPSADLDCSLEEYVTIICVLLDIPVYKSKVQSLHVLFTLYAEFKNSQHFKALAMENKIDNDTTRGGDTDRLIL